MGEEPEGQRTGEASVGRRASTFTATELSEDERPAVLRAYLKKWKFEVGVFFAGVGPDSSADELLRISPDHPVSVCRSHEATPIGAFRPRALVLTGVLVAVAVVAAALMLRHGTGRGRLPRTVRAPRGWQSSSPCPRAHLVSPYVAAAQRMSLDQLAGQRIIYAYSGLRPPRSLLDAIRAGKAAGVIFFENNISSVGQIRGVIGACRTRRNPALFALRC